MSLSFEKYEAEVQAGILSPDAEQCAVMSRLGSIEDELVRRKSWKEPSRSLFARWTKPSNNEVRGVCGLYLWGGVGRGKTHLCDLFFESLPIEQKTRLHFHRFMQRIHDDLRKLEGVENPMEQVADDWAARSRLLLLDEIHVNDITDAMLLGGLLTALFKRGVTLITTSNVAPDGLYRDGLQRARFLPAIAQICNHTGVLEMVGVTDYRLRLMQTKPIYCVSRFVNGKADNKTQKIMQSYFDQLRTEHAPPENTAIINGRKLPVLGRSADLVWFSFDTLCNTPRSTSDYIEIGSYFQTVIISDIPVMGSGSDDAARRFVNLIDEFYDRHVKLIVSAEASAEKLYTGEHLAFEFERAASRLFEMQGTAYLESEKTR
ncbi:cell division protein ZapE [Granulosicoccus antarcticus]|uniref:cell division protein ZapE n=1 Tax=Granulosicoccus antarcticus TaxID=437505 RepID=UPI0012FD3A80|nr:cell division protein ZapE [Granulosicoccus antarcticus]